GPEPRPGVEVERKDRVRLRARDPGVVLPGACKDDARFRIDRNGRPDRRPVVWRIRGVVPPELLARLAVEGGDAPAEGRSLADDLVRAQADDDVSLEHDRRGESGGERVRVGPGLPLLLAGRGIEGAEEGAEVVDEDRAVGVRERRGRPELEVLPEERTARIVEGVEAAGRGDVDDSVDDHRSAVDEAARFELPERAELVRVLRRDRRLAAVRVARAEIVAEHRP